MNETILTPANVNQNSFGKLLSHKVDGAIYAQPLYVANVSVVGVGVRNGSSTAPPNTAASTLGTPTAPAARTDGRSGEISVIDPTNGISSIAGDINQAEVTSGSLHVTGTPVIDPSTNAMYFVAQTYESDVRCRRAMSSALHAIDIRRRRGNCAVPSGYSGDQRSRHRRRNPGQTVTVFNSQRDCCNWRKPALPLVNLGWSTPPGAALLQMAVMGG